MAGVTVPVAAVLTGRASFHMSGKLSRGTRRCTCATAAASYALAASSSVRKNPSHKNFPLTTNRATQLLPWGRFSDLDTPLNIDDLGRLMLLSGILMLRRTRVKHAILSLFDWGSGSADDAGSWLRLLRSSSRGRGSSASADAALASRLLSRGKFKRRGKPRAVRTRAQMSYPAAADAAEP